MKEILRGNDIELSWKLKAETDLSKYSKGDLYVYGGVFRYDVEHTIELKDGHVVVNATIPGNLLPLGIYSIEFMYEYTVGDEQNKQKKYGRIKKSQVFVITEDESDTDYKLEL